SFPTRRSSDLNNQPYLLKCLEWRCHETDLTKYHLTDLLLTHALQQTCKAFASLKHRNYRLRMPFDRVLKNDFLILLLSYKLYLIIIAYILYNFQELIASIF